MPDITIRVPATGQVYPPPADVSNVASVGSPDAQAIVPPGVDPADFAAFQKSMSSGVDPRDAEAFAKLSEPVSSDVAKSLGSGLVSGAAITAGLPGDVRQLASAGVTKAGEYLGVDPATVNQFKDITKSALSSNALTAPFATGPTSQQLTDLTEQNITGPLHKPSSVPGEYAHTVGEFIPGALLGPARSVTGLVMNVLKYGILPALTSETVGQVTKGSAVEPYARAGSAVAAGGVTAFLSRPGSAKQALLKQLPSYVTEAHIDRAEKLISAAKNRGINLTWAEALSKVTGKPVLADTQRILESTGDSRATMQDFLGPRPQQVERAARSEFDTLAPPNKAPSTIGPQAAEAAESTITDVRKAINKTAEPFYQSAEGVLLSPQEMVQVEALPGYADAAKAVRADPQLNRYVSHLPDNSVGFLNEVKKYLDQQANNANRMFAPNPNMQRAAGLGKDAKAVSVAAQNKSVDYSTALALESNLRQQYLEPLMNGPVGKLAQLPDTKKAIELLFTANPLPGSEREIATTLSAVAKRSPQAARDLIRAHAEMVFNEAIQNLQGGANEFGGAKFAARLVGNTQQRANLKAAVEAVYGKRTWLGFEKFLDILEATGKRQQIGSKTAFNIEELKSLGSGTATAEAIKTITSPSKWWSFVHDKWSRYQVGSNLDELAKILTDPRSGQIFKELVRMPSRSNQAVILTGRLLFYSDSSARKPENKSSNQVK